MRVNKIIILFFVIVLIVSNGCANKDTQQEEYDKCTSVCASVLDEDFVTMKLCMDECQEEFLEEK